MNNKGILILNGVLVIAVAILFFMNFSAKSSAVIKVEPANNSNIGSPEKTKKPFDSSYNNLRISFVNSDTVSKYFLFSKKLETSLSKKRNSAESQIKTKYSEYQKMVAEYQQAAQIMGQNEAAEKAQQIALLEQEIMQLEQTLGQKLSSQEFEISNNYIIKTNQFMQEIGKQLGYDYVFSYRVGGLMLFANPDLDITNEIIELLNKHYIASEKK